MPYLETPDELADALADLLGIYGVDDLESGTPGRPTWVGDMADRIRKSVENERTVLRLPEKGG